MKAIIVDKVTYAYEENIDVIKDVSFSIDEGEYIALIGHNGSGKSTIAKLIAGLLPAKNGNISVFGLTINAENINEIRNNIGIVFQNPDNQFIGSTVRDDIAFGLENHLVPRKEMDEIINKYASLVQMNAFLDREPESLSGGQKQRVALAGVLAMQPHILILDEATSMLDPQGKKEIKEAILMLHKHFPKMSILSITHDIEEANLADKVIVMNEGKVILLGKPGEVFKHEKKLKEIGLDIPFSFYICNLFKAKGIILKNNNLEGMAEELWQLNSKK